MRRYSIGMSLAAMAAASFIGLGGPQERTALRPSAPRISNEQRRQRAKHKKGPSPAKLTAQTFDRDRLIVDRASSFKKLKRWARRSPDNILQPTQKALERHGWYQRKQRALAA